MKTPYLDEMIEELRILRTQNSLTKYAFNLLYELEEIKRALSLGGVVGQSEQLKCEDCKKPLPEGMKHKCYECWDDIYCPK